MTAKNLSKGQVEKRKPQLSIRLTDSEKEALDTLARKGGVGPSVLAGALILQVLDHCAALTETQQRAFVIKHAQLWPRVRHHFAVHTPPGGFDAWDSRAKPRKGKPQSRFVKKGPAKRK